MSLKENPNAKILIVDDELSIRITLGEFLLDEGYQVETAENAMQAQSILSKRDFDIVITDIIMPRINGMKLLEQIKEKTPDTQVILITGEPTVETASKAVRSNAYDYLTKPIKKTDLIKTVSNAVRLKNLEQERQELALENQKYQHNLEKLIEQRTEALQKSEKQLQLLLKNTVDIIWQMDLKLNFTYVSPSIFEITGYTQEEWLGTNLSQHATRKKFLKMAGYAFGTIRRFPKIQNVLFESEIIKKNGEEVPVEIFGKLLLNEKSIPYGLQGTTRDISIRHQAEKKQQESEEQFKTLYNNSPDLFASVSLDQAKITLCNETLLKETGFLKEEIIGSSVFELYHEDQINEAHAIFQKLKETGEVHDNQSELKRFDGSKIPVSLNAHTARNESGEVISALFSWRNITERKEDEKRIQRLLNQQIAANNLGLALGETNDLNKVFKIIYAHVKKLMDVTFFAVSHYDEVDEMIYASYLISGDKPFDVSKLPPIPLEEPGKGTQSQVIHTGESLYISNYPEFAKKAVTQYTVDDSNHEVSKQPLPEDEEESTKSALLVPMKDQGNVVGVLQIQSYQLNAYTQDDIDLLSSLANFASMSIKNAQLFNDTQLRTERLKALRKIDQAISIEVQLQDTLNIVLEQVLDQLKIDAATVLLYHKENRTLNFAVERGFRTDALQHSSLRMGEGHAGTAAKEKRTVYIPDLTSIQTSLENSKIIDQEEFVTYLGEPLIAKGEIIGVLEIFNRTKLEPEIEWFEFLSSLSVQAAIAIDNATLFTNLEKANLEVTQSYNSTLEGWAKALELKDTETVGHSKRVVHLTIQIARRLRIQDEHLDDIRRGALLHDVGKMGVPDSILQKKGPLTDEEWVIMRKHPGFAYEWLSQIPYLKNALDIPYCHHEKWDGSGYPRGLKQRNIPLAARIFAVIDVWDALSSNRPYRRAWSKDKTLSYMKEQSGFHFDPKILEIFFELIENNKI